MYQSLTLRICLVFFGIFVYSYQGQYSFNPVMQGLSPYNWQTACNIMNLITGLIAAALYGNIGIKVVYLEVLQELFNAPPLTTTAGKMIWVGLVPAYVRTFKSATMLVKSLLTLRSSGRLRSSFVLQSPNSPI